MVLEHVIELLESGVTLAHIIGVRLRPPQINSRFGVPISSPDVFQRLIRLVKHLPSGYEFGIHFHIPSSEIGLKYWWRVFNSMLRWGQSLEISSGKKVQCLDIGGGFYPGDLQEELQPKLENIEQQLTQMLPSLREIILEPGKSIVQPAMGLAVRVLEIRRSQYPTDEAVVDGSIAELPEAWRYPHRVLHISPNGELKMLHKGKSRLLGRICMESDVLVTDIEIPLDMREGDILIFCDAGAYDRSMAYAFGQG